MRKKLVCAILGLVMVFSLVACQQSPTGTETSSADTSSAGTMTSSGTSTGPITMTSVGTPRAETLVVDMGRGGDANIGVYNFYLSNAKFTGDGYRTLVLEPLWDRNSYGEIVPILAEGMAEPLDDTYTKFEVKLRQGVYWSDGVELTSADVVFTADMLTNNTSLTQSSWFTKTIKSIMAVDDYTIQIETVNRDPNIEITLGDINSAQANFYVVPKHVYENEDVTTFTNPDCIWSGPYKVSDYDENGNWILYERREDWDRSATGVVCGEPTPKHVLYIEYGTEEKAVMALESGELDYIYQVSLENFLTLKQKTSEIATFTDGFPYGKFAGSAEGILFNCAVDPYDNVNVRWALTLSLDIDEILLTAYSGTAIVSPIATMPTNTHEKYTTAIEEWLKTFSLSDGYKPFDDSVAASMVNSLGQQGYEGLPSDIEGIKGMFGIGWWKYDTSEAEQLLLAEGFTRDSKGMWLKPDGTPWQITFVAPGYNVQREALATAVVGYWKDFGIDAVVQSCDSATYQSNLKKGLFDVCYSWPNLSFYDMIGDISQWTSDRIAPVGEDVNAGYSKGACSRWASDKIDTISAELNGLATDDTKVDELTIEFLKEIIINNPFMTTCSNKWIAPGSTQYWTGFPNSENCGDGGSLDLSNGRFLYANLQATGKN